MSLEALEQALLEAKWGDAEGTPIEILSRLFDVPEPAVERILYAAAKLRGTKRFGPLVETMDDGVNVPEGVRDAINEHVDQAFRRMAVRSVIETDGWLFVKPKHLIAKDHGRICAGCLISMECAVRGLSSPDKCYRRGPPSAVKDHRGDPLRPGETEREGVNFTLMRVINGGAKVKPVKLAGDTMTVTCEHPKGTYEVNVMDILL